ncbi:MAG: PEP-CTERM sorting domain-containing protein [Pirellulaceae bacterium]|nr:PEP-CTERM sorting domain-containing protein [Planctomycetaceae bacterium]MDG2384576.1 PEP-CTERM sorting domain-containing protein [Pirellulaceae bacterium]
MKLRHSLLFLFCLSLTLTSSASADGLVGYWDFDDNTADQSGNGNEGEILGGVSFDADIPTSLPAGGKSAAFDGAAGTLVNVTQNSNLPLTTQSAFTISMWVKGEGTANSDDRVFSEGMTTNNNPLFNLGTKNNSSDAKFDFFFRNGGSPGHQFSNGDLFDDTWRHMAWVDTDHVGTLYIDGVEDQSFDYASFVNDGFAPDTTTLGGILRGSDCCNFLGNIDDAAIYDFALSDGQVASLAAGASPLSIPEPSSLTIVFIGLAGLLRFRKRS